jgi:hypothetical protein
MLVRDRLLPASGPEIGKFLTGSYFMLNAFGGSCLYDESARYPHGLNNRSNRCDFLLGHLPHQHHLSQRDLFRKDREPRRGFSWALAEEGSEKWLRRLNACSRLVALY